jgi:hypothetical protein
VVVKETSYNSHIVVESWHGFNPFHEIIKNHNDVLVTSRIRRVTFHEINGPFVERACGDDRVQWGWRVPHPRGLKFFVNVMLNYLNAICEYLVSPIISYACDLLGSDHIRKMATTSIAMEDI